MSLDLDRLHELGDEEDMIEALVDEVVKLRRDLAVEVRRKRRLVENCGFMALSHPHLWAGIQSTLDEEF